MKLIFCPICTDIIRLSHDNSTVYCECKKSSGRYVNQIDAIIYGEAIPLGISNESFSKALRNRPQNGLGIEFKAFVIPVECKSIIIG
jgi:hypothetical protein